MDICTHATIPSPGNFLLYLHATMVYTMVHISSTCLDVLEGSGQKWLPFAVFLIFTAVQTIITYITNGMKAAVPLSMT